MITKAREGGRGHHEKDSQIGQTRGIAFKAKHIPGVMASATASAPTG